MSKLKNLLSAAIGVLLSLPLWAQERTDTAFVFRFMPEKDMFYAPWRGNGRALDGLAEAIRKNRSELRAGQMYILVSCYAPSGNSGTSEKRMAYVRSSRVKSELIIRCGATENMFLTERYIPTVYGMDKLRDVVVVTFPASLEKVSALADEAAVIRVKNYNDSIRKPVRKFVETKEEKQPEDSVKECPAVDRNLTAEEQSRNKKDTVLHQCEEKVPVQTETDNYAFALRADLLRWATLTPDLGLEWRINRSWSIMVNGAWTSWSWNSKDRRYALWEMSPEVRYYVGKEKRGYIGAMYKAGQFNYKLSATGKQGDLTGGGIVGGYQLWLNNALSLDFNLGVGCVHADYEKYEVIDGVRVRQDRENKNWWGPVNAGVTLVWKLF